MRRYLITSCLVLAVFTLFSATQAQADTIDNFNYQAGGNTFAWQLPSSPTIMAGNFIPGFSFTLTDVAYSENGIPQTPATLEFFQVPPLGGGITLQIFVGNPALGVLLIDAATDVFGQFLYSGSENAPTFLTGTFSMIDNASGTPTPGMLTVTQQVPEPSSLMLLGAGMLALLGFALKKASSSGVTHQLVA